MPYSEAKEHAPGKLHALLEDPYQAFENTVQGKRVNLTTALQALLTQPLNSNTLRLRVIHGWENGNFGLDDLRHSDHPIRRLDDMATVLERYNTAQERLEALPFDELSLLATPLAEAIEQAERSGQQLDAETRQIPARWPTFNKGLTLYTLFKVYHRLTYGEDDVYRSIRCKTADGPREIHEFHLDEGEFAISTPIESESQGTTLLILHESQLSPVLELLEECL